MVFHFGGPLWVPLFGVDVLLLSLVRVCNVRPPKQEALRLDAGGRDLVRCISSPSFRYALGEDDTSLLIGCLMRLPSGLLGICICCALCEDDPFRAFARLRNLLPR